MTTTDTRFLMDLLLEPAQALRRELGCSFDLVCIPEAEAAAEYLAASINRPKKAQTRPMVWFDPRICDWVCSLHDHQNCDFCGVKS